ncbi:MAG TPA: hypothetical protein VIV09_02520 [Pseudolabrys sp.]
MRRNPDERWHAVKAATIEPTHPIEAECWKHIHQQEMSPAIDRALEIYLEPFERERLQPWILAGAHDEDIESRVGVSRDVVYAYKHLFFNTKVFRDMLEKQLWVSRYNGTAEGMAYLQKAVLFGLEAVAHVMGAETRLDPHHVIESAMRDMFFRGQAIRHAALTSPATTAAHSLLKTAAEHAQILSATRPATVQDILVKVKNREMTLRVEDVVPHGEILH